MSVAATNPASSLPVFVGPPVPANSGGGFREAMQQMSEPQASRATVDVRGAEHSDSARNALRPVRQQEKQPPWKPASSDLAGATSTSNALNIVAAQPTVINPAGSSDCAATGDWAGASGLQLTGCASLPHLQLNVMFAERLSSAGDTSNPGAIGQQDGQDPLSLAATLTGQPNTMQGSHESEDPDASSGLLQKKMVTQPPISSDGPATGEPPVKVPSGKVAATAVSANQRTGTLLGQLQPIDTSTPTSVLTGTSNHAPLQETAGSNTQTHDGTGAATPASAAEQVRQAVVLSHLPLPSAKPGENGNAQLASAVSSPDGTMSGRRNPGEDQTGPAKLRNEKTHDRSDADQPTTTSNSPSSTGPLLHRMAEIDGRVNPLHAAVNSESTVLSQNASRPGRNADIDAPTETTNPQQLPASDGHELVDGSLTGGTVNTARLVEHLKESEINLNLRSLDLGNIAIHTAMSHERLSAQISLERNDLGKVIAGEVPSLQAKLSQEHGIQATIEVQQQDAAFSGNSSQSRNYTPQTQSDSTLDPVEKSPESTASAPSAVADGRLDIRI